MNLRFISLIAFLLCWQSIYLTGQTDSILSVAIRQADVIASKTFKDNDFPGMAVGVSINGSAVWKKGYGYSHLETKERIDPDSSLFRIGSVSKTVTSAALAQLVEGGEIDLDASIQRYVPTYPKKRYDISVRQIAGHIAGIRHYRGMEFLSNVHYESVKDALHVFDQDSLLFVPGTQYSYSSYGWNLISAAIEEAAGQPFLKFMQESVFHRAGITGILPDQKDMSDDRIVGFYMKNNDGMNIVAPEVDNSIKWAGGGFLGSAPALLQFAHAVETGVLMAPETFAAFSKPMHLSDGKSTNYGIGWRSGEDKKKRHWVGHSGGSMGGSTMFLYYPDYKLCVVTLVNLSGAKTNDLAWRIAEQFIPIAAKKQRQE